MEAFYMQLLVNAHREMIRRADAKRNNHHDGEYDRTHSPESFLITETDWCDAASLPKPRKG